MIYQKVLSKDDDSGTGTFKLTMIKIKPEILKTEWGECYSQETL